MQGLSQLSDAKRVLFDRYSQGRVSSAPKIGRRPQGVLAPLSLVQEQLYFRELEFAGNPPLYNECITVRMLGPLDPDVLERSFNEIIRRHEGGRTPLKKKPGPRSRLSPPPGPIWGEIATRTTGFFFSHPRLLWTAGRRTRYILPNWPPTTRLF